jgi:hypothetical protein
MPVRFAIEWCADCLRNAFGTAPMRTQIPHLLFASLLLSGLTASCGTKTPGPPGGETGTVILGIKSKLVPGVGIETMLVTIKVNGAAVVEETRSVSDKNLAFPMEFRLDGLEDGEPVEAQIKGSVDTAILARLASTEAIAGKELLLETELEASCLQLPGGGAPSCSGTKTCIHGACKESFTPGEKLSDYEPGWATVTTDICKAKGAAEPIVTVGEGQADYLPMDDGAEAQVEAGPQGGHHIWVAVRMKNLTQSGSITSLTGHFKDLGYDVGPFNVIFTFDPDEGGYCKIYGLRFQLDGEHDIEEMLGKTLEVKATITDKDKEIGSGTRTVVLSKTILGG